MKKHFVTFYSPGSFLAESTTKEICEWDTDKAMEMARGIKERYNATPYGFAFSTRERTENQLDSVVTKKSGMYFLGGKVLSLADVKARNDPDDKILISNMECNGYAAVVENTNSWKCVQPLREGDTVLDFVTK